jgi:ABC-type phosphate transport system permease subunit
MKNTIIYVVTKDLSIWIIYFILMKYDFTSETYRPETVSNFPGAPEMGLLSMVFASIYVSIVPLIIDIPLILGLQAYIAKNYVLNNIKPFTLGILLHIPVAAFWALMNATKAVEPNLAGYLGLGLSFIVAGLMMASVTEEE